jgi:hypothetical protein
VAGGWWRFSKIQTVRTFPSKNAAKSTGGAGWMLLPQLESMPNLSGFVLDSG